MIQLTANKRIYVILVQSISIIIWIIVMLAFWRFKYEKSEPFPWHIYLSAFSLLTIVWIVHLIFNILVLPNPPGAKCNRFLQLLSDIKKNLVPVNLSGRWEGWYRSNNAPESWWPTVHEITQRGLEISVIAYGERPSRTNKAKSECAAIVAGEHNQSRTLIWSYKADVTEGKKEAGDQQTGTHYADVENIACGGNIMLGKYINDRKTDDRIGSAGEFKVKWVSRKGKGEIDFCEDKWGLERPSEK